MLLRFVFTSVVFCFVFDECCVAHGWLVGCLTGWCELLLFLLALLLLSVERCTCRTSLYAQHGGSIVGFRQRRLCSWAVANLFYRCMCVFVCCDHVTMALCTI